MALPSEMFSTLKTEVEALESGLTVAVNRYALTLGSRDSWCGWRAVSWGGPTSIDMVILSKGSRAMTLIPGVYTRHDAIGILDPSDTVLPGDKIYHPLTQYWRVESLRWIYVASSVVYYLCDLSHHSLLQTDFASTTWSKTRGTDPRYRTKYFIDQKARVAQITKDDDSTQAAWAAIFANPPYPLSREFTTATVVNGLYVVDEPNSTALVGCDHTTYGYVEHVPVHVCTINTTSCTGEALLWKMIAELRYICETYPTGSLRLLAGERKEDRDLGQGLWLYDRVYTIEYTRDPTT